MERLDACCVVITTLVQSTEYRGDNIESCIETTGNSSYIIEHGAVRIMRIAP